MTVLYALKDKKTEWYVTRNGQFDDLCKETHLFKSKSDALRCLKFQIDNFVLISPLIRCLTNSLLEKKYKLPISQINVSYKEFCDMKDEIELIPVKVQLNEKRTKEQNT